MEQGSYLLSTFSQQFNISYEKYVLCFKQWVFTTFVINGVLPSSRSLYKEIR